MSGYTLEVTTEAGDVLTFPNYTTGELPALLGIAAEQSTRSPLVKILHPDGHTVATYKHGSSRYVERGTALPRTWAAVSCPPDW